MPDLNMSRSWLKQHRTKTWKLFSWNEPLVFFDSLHVIHIFGINFCQWSLVCCHPKNTKNCDSFNIHFLLCLREFNRGGNRILGKVDQISTIYRLSHCITHINRSIISNIISHINTASPFAMDPYNVEFWVLLFYPKIQLPCLACLVLSYL